MDLVSGKVFRKYSYDAGLDLFSVQKVVLSPFETKHISTGARLTIPEGHVGFVVTRSSARGRGLICLSVFDPFYSGEYCPAVTNLTPHEVVIEEGERVFQLVVVPLSRVTIGSSAVRGERGVGSTGR